MQRKRRIQTLLLVLLCVSFVSFFVKNVEADAPLTATDFILNGQYSVDTYLTEENTEHWYKVVIPSDGELEIRIMSYCSNSVNYALYNEDLSQRYKFSSCNDYIPAASETSPVTGTVTKVLSKGTYYFCISGSAGRYKILGKHVGYGTNDDAAYSYDSPLDYTLGGVVTGALTETDTEDWFRFNISETGSYSLKIMSYCGDSLDYRLYNEDLSNTYISSYARAAEATSPSSCTETKVLEPGTYYLKLWDAKGKYTMSVQKDATSQSLKLSVTAKRGKKYFVVKTTPYAAVTAQLGSKKWKNVGSGSKGKIKFKCSKKLKKGNKIKIKVTKTGCKTIKKTVKVK